MKLRIASGCLLAVIGTCTLATAQNPFVGTWKLDQAKSHLTGDTVTYSPAADGAIKETTPVASYTFKINGQPYSTPFDSKVRWKQLSPSMYEVTAHRNEMLLATDTIKISPDGKTMTIVSKGTNPNGSPFRDTESYTRTEGASGLMGSWKSTTVKSSTSPVLKFEENGENGLTWILPEIKAKLDLTFDGKDVAPVGPTVPEGLTLSATKNSPRSFSFVEKMNGKEIVKGTDTVSNDGKTLTDVSTPIHGQNSLTAVYDKE